MSKKKIAFLFGAGCEGKGQLDIPSGADFKKDIVLSENVEKTFDAINFTDTYKIKNGCLLSWNSYKTLYETIKENGDLHFVDTENIISDYDKMNSQNFNIPVEEKHRITDRFRNFYKTNIYDVLTKKNLDSSKLSDNLVNFLRYISLCSFSDGLFNSLRYPNMYIKSVNKVLKIYFAAFNSIMKGMRKASDCKSDYDFMDNLKDRSLNSIVENRTKLNSYIDDLQDIILQKKDSDTLYYRIIRNIYEEYEAKIELSVVTTNYTNFAEKVIGLKDSVFYIHGKLDYFESIENKSVKKLSDFNLENDVIFPFIFIPSGIKPVVCNWQIKQYAKAVEAFENADCLIVLGYGLNSDDEHITNMLKERIINGKKILWFYHNEKDKKNVMKILGLDNVICKKSEDLKKEFGLIVQNYIN